MENAKQKDRIIINLNDYPKRIENLYEDYINNYLLVCNPLELKLNGINLLDSKAQKILNHCTGLLSTGKIVSLTGFDKKYILNTLEVFWNRNLIEILGKPNKINLASQSSLKRIDAWFHITNRCNLSCIYCYIHKDKESMNWDVAHRAVDNLISSAATHATSKVLIKFAGGEPLLEFPLITRVIDYSRMQGAKMGIEVNFHLITNGTRISEKIAEYLKVENIAVAVSLDGIATYNDIQRFYSGGRGSFSDVEKGIKLLRKKGIEPFILVTVSNLNLKGLPDLTRYLLKERLGFRFSLCRPLNQISESLVNYIDEVVHVLHQCYDIFEENLPEKYLPFMHQLCDIKLAKKRIRNCGIGSNGVVIGHQGQIAICQALLDYPVGNINGGNIISLIRNQDQFPARECSIDRNKECRNCRWRYLCGGGCPILTKAEFGDFSKASPYCKIFQSCIPRLIRILGLQLFRDYQKNLKLKKEDNHGD